MSIVLPPALKPKDLISERAKTHGSYRGQAAFAQALKELYRRQPNWDNLDGDQKESLELDATKTARILWGDPNFVDHWKDKSGYAELIAGRLK